MSQHPMGHIKEWCLWHSCNVANNRVTCHMHNVAHCFRTVGGVSQHISEPFEWGVLASTTQNDSFSCGILAENALGHEFLPDVYPLIKTTEVSLARMELGLEVI
jgi:hypothetical protein